MRLDDPNSEHPKFQNYLTEIRKLVANDKIVNALAKFGKMSNDQAQDYLQGSKPVLWVFKDITRSESLTEFPERLLVPLDEVEIFEAGGKFAKRLTQKGKGPPVPAIGVHLLELVIFGHLKVFSSDDKDRDPSAWNKAAEGFEQEVYGGLK
jgi:hypothetical protein